MSSSPPAPLGILQLFCRNKAKKAAAALPLALPCGQIKRKCGKCHHIRWLERRLPKTPHQLEEDAAKRKKKKDAADEACRLEAAADDKIKFICRHDVDDEVTRPPCLLIVCCAEWCGGGCYRSSFSTALMHSGQNASTTDG